MLEPNWKQERPSPAAIKKTLSETIFAHVPFESPAIEEHLKQLRLTHANGGAEFAMFSFPNNETLHWFISRNRFSEIDFFERLLTSDTLRIALPQLKAPKKLKSLDWEWSSSYLLDGEMARTLMSGGAYKHFQRGGAEAKRMGAAVCESLFGDRYEDIMLFKTFNPWSDWFCEIAWDVTWIGVDKAKLLIWLLCVTDTD